MSNQAVIIIKRVKKAHHDEAHGGAWKVAYADFVTAMMAFFLLLWLLNATTEEQRVGLSNYFAPASLSKTTSGSGGLMGGLSMSQEGALKAEAPVSVDVRIPPTTTQDQDSNQPSEDESDELSEEEAEKILAEREEAQFEEIENSLRRAIEESPELSQLAESLVIDRTPEGLRIQIVDQARYAMFPLGSAKMYPRMRQLIEKIVGAVKRMPNKVSVAGHTDATPYASGAGYTNWELSTDRANSSRRALVAAGLAPERITNVVGRADKDLFLVDEPTSPRNRRISIVLLREQAQPTQTPATPQ